MRKILCLFWVMMQFSLFAAGQKSAVSYVEEFAKHLHDWSVYMDNRYRDYAIQLCAGTKGRDCVVLDSLMMEFERLNHRMPSKYYSLSNFLQGFHTYIYRGKGLAINITDIKEEKDVLFDEDSLDDEIRHQLNYVSCTITVSGEVTFSSHDLICVRKESGLISQIAPFVGVKRDEQSPVVPLVNTRSIKAVDPDLYTFGGYVGYSSSFPVNMSMAITFTAFSVSMDCGIAGNKTFEVPYKGSDNILIHQKSYVMISLGLFLFHTNLSCGVGLTEYNSDSILDKNRMPAQKFCLSLKPKIDLNIPLSVPFILNKDRFYLSPYLGYYMTPKFKAFNCFEYGLGIRLDFNSM